MGIINAIKNLIATEPPTKPEIDIPQPYLTVWVPYGRQSYVDCFRANIHTLDLSNLEVIQKDRTGSRDILFELTVPTDYILANCLKEEKK